MALNAGSVYAVLGGKFNPSGFVAFDRAMKGAAGSARKAETSMVASTSRTSKAMAAMGKVALTGGAIGVAALGAAMFGATKKAMGFEAQMKSFAAVAGRVSRREMRALEKQALSVGVNMGIGATEAAKAMTELVKGGVGVQDILKGGLRGTLALAAAGEMDVAMAAETAANAMNLFGMRGQATTHVADALAKAANDTTGEVHHFAMALTQGGGAAKAAGLSFDETIAALEALAFAGVRGSDAGTSLKAAFTQIARPTKQSADTMRELGIELFDAQGNMKALPAVADELRDGLSDLTRQQRLAALTTIAGTDGMRALLALYDAGPKKIHRLLEGLDAQGTAQQVATEKLDGAAGALKRLGAAFESAQIIVGNELLPMIAEQAEDAAKWLRELAESGDLKRFGQGLAEALGTAVETIRNVASEISDLVAAYNDLEDAVGIEKALKDANEAIFPLKEIRFDFKIGGKEQLEEVSALYFKLQDLRGHEVAFRVVTNAKDAESAIAGMNAVIAGVPPAKAVRILQNAPSASAAVEGFQAVLAGVPMRKVVTILQNANSAEGAVRSLKAAIDAVPTSKHTTFTVTTYRREVLSQIGRSAPMNDPVRRTRARGRGPVGAEAAIVGEGRDPREFVINSRTGEGFVTDRPMLADLRAEDFVIPTDPGMRPRAMDLFMALASDLGVAMFAKGRKGKKKGKGGKGKRAIPPSTFLRLDPDEFRSDRDDAARGHDRAKDRVRDLERTAKEKDYKGNLTDRAKRAAEKLPKAKRQLAAAKQRLDRAKAINRKAQAHANAIAAAEDNAEIARLAMVDADNRNHPGDFDAARKRRMAAHKRTRTLLRQALRYAKPGSRWRRDILKALGALKNETFDTSTAAIDLPEPDPGVFGELTDAEERQIASAEAAVALAELTDPTDDDMAALGGLDRLLSGLLGGRQAMGADPTVIRDLANDVGSVRERIKSLAGTTSEDRNIEAELEQARRQAEIARRDAQISQGALRVFGGAGDLAFGRTTTGAQITINTLHPGDPRVLDAIGRAATSGIGYQGTRTSPRLVTGL